MAVCGVVLRQRREGEREMKMGWRGSQRAHGEAPPGADLPIGGKKSIRVAWVLGLMQCAGDGAFVLDSADPNSRRLLTEQSLKGCLFSLSTGVVLRFSSSATVP